MRRCYPAYSLACATSLYYSIANDLRDAESEHVAEYKHVAQASECRGELQVSMAVGAFASRFTIARV